VYAHPNLCASITNGDFRAVGFEGHLRGNKGFQPFEFDTVSTPKILQQKLRGFFILVIKKNVKIIVNLENCITFADKTCTKTLKIDIKYEKYSISSIKGTIRSKAKF